MHNQIGVDLGGATVVAAVAGRGVVLREPAVVAIDRETGKVLAAGAAAEQKLNTATPVALKRPFGNGLTGVPEETEAVLDNCLSVIGLPRDTTDLLLSVPCDITDAQEETLADIAMRLGVHSCRLVYSPLAAIAGSFMNIPGGCLVVDIGAAKTNVILICRGRIYYMKSLAVGGQAIDRAIADYIQKKRRVRISLRTAEQIKCSICSVCAGTKEAMMDVTGKDSSNKPVSIRVTAEELYGALEEPIGAILESVWIAVSKIPSEYVKNVFELGIQLVGGGACLDGLERMISGITGVKARRVDEPAVCTAVGLAEILSQLPEDVPATYRNISEIFIKHIGAMK